MIDDQPSSVVDAASRFRQGVEHTIMPERLNERPPGGTSSGMETRVTRLEVEMEGVKRDLAEILGIVRQLPTKSDLNAFRWQWVATAVAAIALIVGGIIGGLGWIKPDAPASTVAAAPAPIVIQVPTASTPPARR